MSDAVVAIRLRAMGDVVLTTPAFRSLAAGGRELHVVTESRFAPLLDGLPWIARVWGIEREIPTGKTVTLTSNAGGGCPAADMRNDLPLNVAVDSTSATPPNIQFKLVDPSLDRAAFEAIYHAP